MKSITVRNIDETMEKMLKEKRLKTGKSINTIILEALESLLIPQRRKKQIRYSDLDSLAGTWSVKEEREFYKNTAGFGEVDEEMWK